MGQVAAIALAMLIVTRPTVDAILLGDHNAKHYIYLLFFLLWILTTTNSFNFSDNINGLMSGLAIIGILASIVYLGEEMPMPTRFIVLGFILVGAILGFIPFNFPRARIFIGDAGSMFVGYCVGVFAWPLLSKGFLEPVNLVWGLDGLVAPFLVLGVPLFDACFVLIMRVKEGRPIYLGDNKHLSHRLVRSGFSVTEATLLLWGAALVVAGVGALALQPEFGMRAAAFAFGVAFLIVLTTLICRAEGRSLARAQRE
jgi:UDP-GlcNAc:undecaprenyl-phosphate GlcNAc-1-phosphate transferase